MDRYHRQTLLPEIGPDGQAKLVAARAAVLGCGALGTVAAELMARAGIGQITLIDRDLVERTNLQRQMLFAEADVDQPKATAAADRLRRINSDIAIEPIVADAHAGNLHELLSSGDRPSVIVDGSDNAEVRYLLNDWCVREDVPWVYGAAVGRTGRVMSIVPGVGPCLRCVFCDPPAPGELPTCDTVGVFGPLTAIVASMQATAGIELILGKPHFVLSSITAWPMRTRSTDVGDARRADCPACGQRRFEFLDAITPHGSTSLCGQNAIQVKPPGRQLMDLALLADRMRAVGVVQLSPFFTRLDLPGGEIRLTVFRDARAIVQGTRDPAAARSLYARYVGG